MSSPPDLKLAWCSHEAAKYAVEHWHYSKSLPPPPMVHIGVWERGAFVGAVLFSRGANNNIGKGMGLDVTEVAELTRVALSVHRAPVSRILSIAMRMARALAPGLRLFVSYADPSHEHHGGIYQATGWTYVGRSGPSTEYVAPDGKQWHGRMVSSSGRKRVYGQTRTVWRHDQCTPVAVPGKHKYLMPLDDEMRARVAPLARPYPKRVRPNGADEHHSPAGGVAPTRTLHLPSEANARP